MKLLPSFILIAMITVSCEGPVGPIGPEGDQGVTGEQGIQGIRGETRIMFDNKVAFVDYYRSPAILDTAGVGAWMAGIEHDSIKTTSEITVYDIFADQDSLQVWTTLGRFSGEVIDGRIGLFDPNINIYVGLTLRIIVTN